MSALQLLALLSCTVAAWARELSASSLVTCMENSLLSASYFDVVFNPDDGSLHYTLDFSSEVSDYIVADVDVYAYGFKIISKEIDLCDLDWKQFCPLYPGDVEIDSIEYISDEYTSLIPGIAYQVPDIDAFARVSVKDTNGTELACIQAFFTNGKTVAQTGVKWATAVIAGVGLLVAALASVFGNSNAASHISANAVSLFLYFQSVVVIAMQHVDTVPPIASAWAENLAWSMGLIRISFMQKIFRWYVQSTGGSPTLYLTSSTINVLAQRSFEVITRGADIAKRSSLVLYANSTVIIARGIKRMAYLAGIENTSVVCTGFTFFILFAYLLVCGLLILKYGSEVCIRAGWMKASRFYELRQNWSVIIKGALSRYILIGFTQLMLLSLWEFVERDSPAIIVLAILFLLLALGVLLWSSFRVHKFARASLDQHKNPAAILYGNQNVLDKYGFMYTMFTANRYWWGNVLLLHTFIKCIFIALCQSSGKTQAIVFWIIDMVYLGLLIHFKPYLNTPTNVINILIQVVTTLNSFLFTFFSNIFGQPAMVSSIMGWVFFILNAAFSLILLVLILVFCGYVVFSKNPDARFKPATDDRTSFQRFSYNGGQKGPTAELLALGLAAKDHNENWETEIHKLQDVSKSTEDSSNNDEDRTVPIAEDEKETFAGKMVRKLTKGRSTKRSKSTNQGKRLLSDASYMGDNTADDVNIVDDMNDDVPEAEYTFEQTHRKDESVASFHHAVGQLNEDSNGTSMNDFIGGNKNTSTDQVNYSKF